jgi:hypothetical protein
MHAITTVKKLVAAAVLAAMTGCGPAAPTPPVETKTVAVRVLYESHIDGSARWTGRRVRVFLDPGEYRVSPQGLHWDGDRPGVTLVLFRGASVSGAPTTLVVEGTVSGVRQENYRQVVVVDECHVLTGK